MKVILTEEQLKYLIEITTSDIDAECKNVNLNPTDAQKEAGNYKMGHFRIKGMPISIENPKGSVRKYKNDKEYGQVIMKNHYGYFTNTTGNGKDGDAVDVFIGPYPDDFERVYVIDQNNKEGEFDESKVMLGFKSKNEAKEAYFANYSDDWDGFRTITSVSLRLFKKWLYRGNKQRKPFSEYVEIQKKKLEESKKKLNEIAYINGIKGKKAMIHYEKGANRSKGSLYSAESLKTDLMDQTNQDTYEVTLKGGIKSYNITSIKGQYVMQYFKHYFDSKKAKAEYQGQEYEMDMETNEFNQFMAQFIRKIEFVVKYKLNTIKSLNPEINFNTVSIYPIKSSSNFNVKMAEELSKMSICGMHVQMIDTNVLTKDLKNLQIDNEFVRMNQGFFDSPRSKTEAPVINFLKNDINKNINAQNAQRLVGNLNDLYFKIIHILRNLPVSKNQNASIQRMAEHYKKYADCIKEIVRNSRYHNEITGEDSKTILNKLIVPIKYSKGPSIEKRTEKIINLIKPYLWGLKSPIDNEPYLKKIYEICEWRPSPFEIKNTSNGERMGMKNIYRFNDTTPEMAEHVKEELNRIRGTLFVIFDDNISGGATLSDVCYQFLSNGVERFSMIPITFGQMAEKWTYGRIPLFKPEGGFNFTDDPTQSPKYHNEVNENVTPKKKLTMLWVDDQRGPEKHFKNASKQTEPENPKGTKDMNYIAFRELMNMYDITFNWVKTLTEFVNYIKTNGVPEFISFDRDLPMAPGYDGKSGSDCARWLSEYCKKNGFRIPKYFIHSANINAYDEITSALSTKTLFTPSNNKFKFKRREQQ